MRVLFVTEEPIRFTGTMVRGGQIHVRNVVTGLQDRDHDVHLVDWNSDPERPFQHSIAPRSRFVDGAVRTFQQLVRVGRTTDIDVIVSKTRKVYLPGLAAARVLGVPHVVHVGSSLDPPTSGPVDRLDAISFAARLRAPHDGYFVVCDAIAAELRDRGVRPEQIYDVRNAVDETRFVPEPDVELPVPIAEKMATAERPLLGFVGGLIDYKGVFDLAAAVRQMETTPTIVVAGEGPARDRFERELGEQGIFLGSIAYDRMPALYAALDALVIPSHTEGLPRVLLEASAAGRPTVSTAVGGIPEVIGDEDTGLLCEPKQPAQLAAAIDDLFSNRDPSEMGRRARKLIADKYTWEAQYDRYDAFLSEVVSEETPER